jgi:lipopolysaccharide/colanic/teichoic acid biosynthesis glycosyltransferase
LAHVDVDQFATAENMVADVSASSGSPALWRRPAFPLPPYRVAAAAANFLRRSFDIAFAVVCLVLAAPVLLAAMAAIRLESRGPALYRQPRMGRDGRIFQLVKLRGMYLDARERFPELYNYGSAIALDPNRYFFHHRNDPRVTRVGRVLRKYSIDELPNFWNVLRGHMSIVGPRPEIPELANLYGVHLERFLSVRPGVTSPAKAMGRDEMSFAETLASDLEYIETRSFRRDLLTIYRTVRTAMVGANVR